MSRNRSALFFSLLASLLPIATRAQSIPYTEEETTALLDARKESDRELAESPISPLATVGRKDLKEGESVELTGPQDQPWIKVTFQDGKFVLNRLGGPDPLLEGEGKDEEKKPITEGAKLPPNSVIVGDTHAVRAYVQEGQGILMLCDRNRPAMKDFKGLNYFDPNAAYRVQAKLVRSKKKIQDKLPTTQERIKTFYRIGTLEFQMDGQTRHLTCHSWDEKAKSCNVFFRDSTTGKETYGAGRYLDVEIGKDDQVVLDFNKAYNPWCAFTTYYNCPIPPAENHLPIAILAGEKNFEQHP